MSSIDKKTKRATFVAALAALACPSVSGYRRYGHEEIYSPWHRLYFNAADEDYMPNFAANGLVKP